MTNFPSPACALLAISLFGLALVPTASARTFNDPFGRTMEAEVISVTGDKVNIKRSDGKVLLVKIDSLSEADQIYIKEWIKKNPSKVQRDIAFQFTKRDGVVTDFPRRKLHYLVAVRNSETEALKGITIRSQIFAYIPRSGVVRISNEHKIPELPAGKKAEFDTSTCGISESWSRLNDYIYGIWVRVYQDGKVIAEHIDENRPGSLKGVTWDVKKAGGEDGVIIK